MDGISTQESSLPPHPASLLPAVETQWEVSGLQPRKDPPPEPNQAGTLIQTSSLQKYKK